MNKKRLFFAIKINLSAENRNFIKNIKNEFKHERFKWVENKNIHLTLKFLGDTDVTIIPSITKAIEKNLSNIKSFDLTIKGLGFFKNISNPRVLWMGVEKNNNLNELFNKIEDTVEIFGFKRETREFNPHITIARIKSLYDKKKFLKFILDNTDRKIQCFTIKEIFLMESILKREGPVYIEEKKFKLTDN